MASPKTYVNGHNIPLKRWYYSDQTGTYDLFEAYLNGTIVYRRALELYLPDPRGVNSVINLTTFIRNNNPDNYDVVVVYNNYVQPTIDTGSLTLTDGTPMEVTFINNKEIQGSLPGYNALIVRANMILENNGWIRGAGGNGGRGGSYPTGQIIESGRGWEFRSKQTCGGTINSRRWWNNNACDGYAGKYNNANVCDCGTAGVCGSTIRNWCIGSGYTSDWGDQKNVKICKQDSNGYKTEVFAAYDWVNGNAAQHLRILCDVRFKAHTKPGGAGGRGQCFTYARTGGLSGADASIHKWVKFANGEDIDGGVCPVTSTIKNSNGDWHIPSYFDGYTGVNKSESVPCSKGPNYRSGDGGDGGYWGEDGKDGKPSAQGNPGESGQAAGAAIIGGAYLSSDSIIGNTTGDVR